MEGAAWHSLYSMSHAKKDAKPFNKATLKRIMGFAAPHRTKLIWFLILSVITAGLAVATPLLAGEVVNAITGSGSVRVIVWLAVLIAIIAIADSGLSLMSRWLSSRIGEALILDLRTAVFDHVLKMPIAFFTRTRTGALVSRLNNDVIGAQRAFSGTLSGVVGNAVMLVLALVAMLFLSWQVTVLALIMLPIFIVPARRMGRCRRLKFRIFARIFKRKIMLSVSNLSVQFGKRILFDEVNVTFTQGNCYGVIGANGAGKSTFLRILSGQIDPTSGRVNLEPGKRMSILEQDHNAYDASTVLETVVMGNKPLFAIKQQIDEVGS